MSYDKKMEKLLISARKLPTELSYDEVEFLFLNPNPLPPARPWWRGGYLKFLLMFALLVSLLGFFSYPQADSTNYLLSAFPVQETTSVYTPVDSLPVTSELLALETAPTAYITPRVKIIVPETPPAPASAPLETAAVEKPLPPQTVIPEQTPTQSRSLTQMPEALFTGTYSHHKDNFMLVFAEVEDGPAHLLFIGLSKDEQRTVKNHQADPLVIERAAGSILLYGGDQKGTFEFLPNTAYRSSFNALGWGDAAAPDSSLVTVTMGKRSEEEREAGGIKATQPRDQLWFRYFAFDINEAYIDLLRQYGYGDTDFHQLWKLANAMLSYGKLEDLLKLSSAVLTDRPSLEAIASLKYDLDDLRKLKARGQRMSYAEFRADNARPKLLQVLTGVLADSTIHSKARAEAYARYWSTKIPGTVREAISGFPHEGNLNLKGNFKVKLIDDPDQDTIVAYGRNKAIRAMKRKSKPASSLLVNPRRKHTIYLEIPKNIKWSLKPKKGVTIKMDPQQR